MKNKKVLFASLVIILLFSFVFLLARPAAKMTLSTSAVPEKKTPHIIIDAGHGGEDGGAVGRDGVLEKEINLSVSNDLYDLLTFFGFEAEKTRRGDGALTNEGDTVKERKYNDMKMRLDIFNSSDNNVIISVHQNQFSDSSSHGTQVFYSPNNEKSLQLADSIKFTVKKLMQPDNERQSKPAGNGIFLLKNTDQPAVIVECGFLSNAAECEKLTDKDYQKQMAFSIATGFTDFYHQYL